MKTPCTKIISAIISLAFLYLSPGQSAETGDREIQIGGGFFLAQGDAATGTAQFEAAYSYMWTPNWQVGARATGQLRHERSDRGRLDRQHHRFYQLLPMGW